MAKLTDEEEKAGLVDELAGAARLDPRAYWGAVKRMCGCGVRKDRDGNDIDVATDHDFLALLYMAKKYGLDPLLKEVALISTKQGPRPYVGVGGWMSQMMRNPDYIAHDVEMTWSGDKPGAGDPIAATMVIHTERRRKAELGPFRHTEYLRECRVRSDYTPWNTFPARMILEKAIMQGVRFCWNMYVPDLDEVQRYDEFTPPTALAVVPATPSVPIPGVVVVGAAPGPKINVPECKTSFEVAEHGFGQLCVPHAEPLPTRAAPASEVDRLREAVREAEATGEFDDIDLG